MVTKSDEKGRDQRRDALNLKERREPACKPGSVESSHSSWMRVATHLERPTRELVWAHSALPYSVLLRVGFAVPQSVATCAVRSYRTFSPLPHIAVRRYVFCGTFRRLAPPRRYLAPCPVEPGLSSEACSLSDCSADSHSIVSHFAGRYRERFARELGVKPDSAVTGRGIRIALAAYVRSLRALNSPFDRAARRRHKGVSSVTRRRPMKRLTTPTASLEHAEKPAVLTMSAFSCEP